MDYDIDIEEHDVMEDPRIKSIFPDLSIVKMELPDEEDIDGDQYETVPIDFEPQDMVFKCELNTETTDSVSEQSAESLTQEYFFNNQIILGSKPAPDEDPLYLEALHSQVFVYLENLEYHLKDSPCFCVSCGTLFPTENALEAHKMVSHSYLVALDRTSTNTARKSTVTSKYCNHCSKTFPDDTALIKHLYEVLPMNKFSKQAEKPEETSLFKCHKCKKSFKSKEAVRYHKQRVHPTLNHGNNLIVRSKSKIPIKVGLKSKKVVKRNIARGKLFATSLVPKNTLFQCNLCQIGFISCFAAVQHSHLCEKMSKFNKCDICKRKIRVKDIDMHRQQHNFTDKLKIYTVTKNMYEKILCKCPKCLTCFDEILFWTHYTNCNDDSSAYCPDCDVNIATARYENHRTKHLNKKFTKKDFIIIEYHDLGDDEKAPLPKKKVTEKSFTPKVAFPKKVDSKVTVPKRVSPKVAVAKRSDNKAITLYYCDYCHCCQYKLAYKGHGDGSCKNQQHLKYFCEECGLRFSSKGLESHRILHRKKSFTLQDIKMVSLITGATIDIPISEFIKCKPCGVHFVSRRSMLKHKCQIEKHITCKICKKKFNVQTYKLHKGFHLLKNNGNVDEDTKLIPELMKKYDSMNMMWNVIFMCAECDLVTMTYDSAVEHAQGHLNDIQTDLHKPCTICGFFIAEKYYRNHEKLHLNNDSVERNSFKILKYNPKDMFQSEWMSMFDCVEEEHRLQILSKSIYRSTRSVKMTAAVSSSIGELKYLCLHCKKFVDGASVEDHARIKCTANQKYVCQICHEPFNSIYNFNKHECSDEKPPKFHKIITFNNPTDQKFNQRLLSLQKTKDVKTKPKKDAVKFYKLYKCSQCEACNLTRNFGRHTCTDISKQRFCKICNQYFLAKNFRRHASAHKHQPHITKNTIAIIYFNGNSKSESGVAKIFKCVCGLHFTSLKQVNKHFDVCSTDVQVSKEVCSKCKLVFPTEVLVTHLCNHHSKPMEIVIEKVKKFQMFKCKDCHVLFINTQRFNAHLNSCGTDKGIKCKRCGLTFEKGCYRIHRCFLGNKAEALINKITIMKRSKIHAVYKCDKCNICYLSYKSLKYHCVEVKHFSKTTLVDCEYCNLRFTLYSYHKHIKIHSSKENEFRIVVNTDNKDTVLIKGKNDIKEPVKKRKLDSAEKKDTSIKKPKKSMNDSLSEAVDVTDKPRKRTDSARKLNDSAITPRKDTDSESKVPTITYSGHRTRRLTCLRKLRSADKNSDLESVLSTSNTETDGDIEEDNQDNSLLNASDIKSECEDLGDHIIDHTYASHQDSLEASDSPNKIDALSRRCIARMSIHKYTKIMYKCVGCNLHYMKDTSLDYHIKTFKHTDSIPDSHQCDICGLHFSRHTLPRHKYVHHKTMGLQKEDFVILTETKLIRDTKFFEKCRKFKSGRVSEVESTSGNFEDTNFTETGNDSDSGDKISTEVITDDFGDVNKIDSFPESVSESSKNVSVSESVSVISQSASVTEDTEKLSEVTQISDRLYYYKCYDCNVCFVTKEACLNHASFHASFYVELSPRTYIQCKICDFQFMIDSLKDHMDTHHTIDFRIENLTIEEYKWVGYGKEPKMIIYKAVDKVQSMLISTTTDGVI